MDGASSAHIGVACRSVFVVAGWLVGLPLDMRACTPALQALAGYELRPAEASSLHDALAASASGRLDTLVRDAALTRITRMTDRWVGAHPHPHRTARRGDICSAARGVGGGGKPSPVAHPEPYSS